MKIKITCSLLGCFMTVATYAQTTITLKTANDSLSYALGMDIAKTLKSSEFELELSTLYKGLEAVYTGTEALFDENQSSSIIQQHFKLMMDKKNAELRKPGETYLESLKSNPNIQATPEGVLYEVLVQGDGRKPEKSDKVKVHYAGYLIDGTKFDSSYDRGQPIDLNLDQVIAGWAIAVPLMNIGSKYKLHIPYHLAYGERGSGKIPPFSALVFEIELLDIITPNEVQ